MGHTLDPTLIPIWIRFIPTHVGHTIPSGIGIPPHPVHPHIRGAYQHPPPAATWQFGSSPHTWGIRFSLGCQAQYFAVHPHIRGAYSHYDIGSHALVGSSPHTWGILGWRWGFHGWGRFIPTYVGHTSPGVPKIHVTPVHPHIRGAYRCGRCPKTNSIGSSPHTWGIQAWPSEYSQLNRFIPTYVGHTVLPGVGDEPRTVHPHIRGAYTERQARLHAANGSSPHTWGIRFFNYFCPFLPRFIPTYVGHTIIHRGPIIGPPVHPHIRGAYTARLPAGGEDVRFIPTYVGHTSQAPSGGRGCAVHPHIRGAYIRIAAFARISDGSSPHTWGIQSARKLGLRSCPVHPHIRGAYSCLPLESSP